LIAFDVLTAAGHDLRDRPYRRRRDAFELLLTANQEPSNRSSVQLDIRAGS